MDPMIRPGAVRVDTVGGRLLQRARRSPGLRALGRTVRPAVDGALRRVRRLRLPEEERRRDLVTLGSIHRHQLGNQLFQYAYLRCHAETHGLRYETTGWVGEELFDLPRHRITRRLPTIEERVRDVDGALLPRPDGPGRNVDLAGYFQYHTRFYRPYAERIRSWFTPAPRHASVLDEAWQRLRERGRTVVGLHLRRGDYGYEYFFIAPTAWYRRWLDEVWPTLDRPVLFLASDEPEAVVDELADLGPVTAADLDVRFPVFPDYVDFHLLSRCDLLATSNSTFSFWASLLDRSPGPYLRPDLARRVLVPYDPWDALPLLRDERVEEHPDVPGIARDPARRFR